MNLKLLLYAGAAGALLAAIAGYTWKIKSDEAARWRPKLEQAQQATKNAEAVTQALDKLQTQTVVIREKSNAAERIIREAPGADAPIPAELRAALCDSLASLRDGEHACAEADDPSQPAG